MDIALHNFLAHLCILHIGLICVTFRLSVWVCEKYVVCYKKCMSHIQISRWAQCQRQVAFFDISIAPLCAIILVHRAVTGMYCFCA